MTLKIDTLQKKLGYNFKDQSLLTRALTHSSYAYEAAGGEGRDNEVLEFLGDSVLGFILSDFLCRTYPRLEIIAPKSLQGGDAKMLFQKIVCKIIAKDPVLLCCEQQIWKMRLEGFPKMLGPTLRANDFTGLNTFNLLP